MNQQVEIEELISGKQWYCGTTKFLQVYGGVHGSQKGEMCTNVGLFKHSRVHTRALVVTGTYKSVQVSIGAVSAARANQ